MFNFKGVAVAAIIFSSATSVVAEVEFSVEGLLGRADQENKLNIYPTASGDDTSLGLRAGMSFNKYIGLELSYHDYGEISDSYIDFADDTITDYLDTTSFNVGVVGSIPLGEKFAINGRLGIALWDFDFRETDSSLPGMSFKDDDSGVDAYYGIGVQYSPVEHFQLSLEYTVLGFEAEIGSVDVDQTVENLSLAIGYVF